MVKQLPQIIINFTRSFGNIWNHLEPPGDIWDNLSAWCHLEPSRAIWGSPGNTLKRLPALVKQLPQVLTPCGHLGASGTIWSHPEISGTSGAIYSRNHMLRIRDFPQDEQQKCNFDDEILLSKHYGTIWCHLEQSKRLHRLIQAKHVFLTIRTHHVWGYLRIQLRRLRMCT